MELGLTGRAAIVTGASRGIGRATALALAVEGCAVLLCGRDTDALTTVLGEVAKKTGGRAAVMTVDQSGGDASAAIVDACRRAFGRVDILVNNAGGSPPQPLDELTDDQWRAAFDVNFFAAAALATACANVMADTGWGRLVHIASINGREPDALFAPYSAAKAALLSMSKAMSVQFARRGVTSNCVVPGVTLTDLVTGNAAATAHRLGTSTSDVMDRMLRKTRPDARRFGQPEEVADAIAFLASERAAWITGAALTVDGGTLHSA